MSVLAEGLWLVGSGLRAEGFKGGRSGLEQVNEVTRSRRFNQLSYSSRNGSSSRRGRKHL